MKPLKLSSAQEKVLRAMFDRAILSVESYHRIVLKTGSQSVSVRSETVSALVRMQLITVGQVFRPGTHNWIISDRGRVAIYERREVSV